MSALNSRFFTKKGRKYEVIATAYGDSKDGLDALLQYNSQRVRLVDAQQTQ